MSTELKMAWDRDGTYAIDPYGNPMAASTAKALNSGGYQGVFWNDGTCGGRRETVVFPELRDVTSIYYALSDSGFFYPICYYSSDTTTGYDGTFTRYNNFNSLITNVKGMVMYSGRYGNCGNCGSSQWNIYGHVSAGQSLDYLVAWHPTLDQWADGSLMDLGNVQRLATSTRTIRFKNISSTKTARSIQVSMEFPIDANPTLKNDHALSTDNVNYASTITLPDLAPGAISPIVYLRVTPGASDQLQPTTAVVISGDGTTVRQILWQGRLIAQAAVFS